MVHDYAAGGLVYRRTNAALEVALILDRHGNWTLPKGHLDPGESEEQAAQREIAEETGLAVRLGPLIGRIDYQVTKKNLLRDKTVAFFLAEAAPGELKLPDDGEVQAAEWCAPAAALERVTMPQIREALRQGLALLGGQER